MEQLEPYTGTGEVLPECLTPLTLREKAILNIMWADIRVPWQSLLLKGGSKGYGTESGVLEYEIFQSTDPSNYTQRAIVRVRVTSKQQEAKGDR